MKEIYWQKVRGICILAVVLIHTIYFVPENQIINVFNVVIRNFTNFSVAIFFFLSGYFLTQEKCLDNFRVIFSSKLKRLYVPFLLVSGLYLIFRYQSSFFLNVLYFFTGSHTPHLYYLILLLFFYCLCFFFGKKLFQKLWIQKMILCITPVCLLILNIYIFISHSQITLLKYNFAGWISYFFLGFFVRNYNCHFHSSKTLIISGFFLQIVVSLFIFYCGNYELAVSQMKFVNFLTNFSIIFYLLENVRETKSSMLNKIGDVSFFIYLFHTFLILIIRKLIISSEIPYLLSLVIIFSFTIGVTYFLAKILKKLIPKKFQFILGLG